MPRPEKNQTKDGIFEGKAEDSPEQRAALEENREPYTDRERTNSSPEKKSGG